MGAISTLEAALRLRGSGRHQEACQALVELAATRSDDGEIQAQAAFVHDFLGQEREAVPYYQRALALGVSPELTRECLLGLGSTFRIQGRYQEAWDTLMQGREQFPEAAEFAVFAAMAAYNLGRHKEGMQLLLTVLLDTTRDETLTAYQAAIRLYAGDLDKQYA